MVDEADYRERTNSRVKRVLRELQDRRLRRALEQLHQVQDNLTMRQAYGLSYWFAPQHYPDLVEGGLPLVFLSEQDLPSLN